MSVFIIGVPTAGKSTLAGVIKNRLVNVNVFSLEAIRNGFIKTQPELKMDDRSSLARQRIMPEYIVEFARWNEKLTGDMSLVEGSFVTARDLARLISENDMAICLGYGGKSREEIAEIALARVTKDNYLYGCTIEKFVAHFYDIDKLDRDNMEFCEHNSILYFDVSEGWSEVEGAVLEMLSKA